MKVALFFDGPSFYAGWRDAADGRRIDFPALSEWLVKSVGGSASWAAHYYTAIDAEGQADGESNTKLGGFLDMLELQPGYFVKSFVRPVGALGRTVADREVETAMVADMVRHAAQGTFDAMVLLSGDGAYAPALNAVRALGRRAHIATWGSTGVSRRLRVEAFNHIDLSAGLNDFVLSPSADMTAPPVKRSEDEVVAITGDAKLDAFIAEMDFAEQKFEGGYVGAGYFISRWRSNLLDSDTDARRALLDRAIEAGLVETYQAPDGATALRLTEAAFPED